VNTKKGLTFASLPNESKPLNVLSFCRNIAKNVCLLLFQLCSLKCSERKQHGNFVRINVIRNIKYCSSAQVTPGVIQWRSQPTTSGGAKMFAFRWATMFCLE